MHSKERNAMLCNMDGTELQDTGFAYSCGLTQHPQLLEPHLCNKEHLESCLNSPSLHPALTHPCLPLFQGEPVALKHQGKALIPCFNASIWESGAVQGLCSYGLCLQGVLCCVSSASSGFSELLGGNWMPHITVEMVKIQPAGRSGAQS